MVGKLERTGKMTDQPSFTCHHCGAKSFNIYDLMNGYCGRCHHFCKDVDDLIRLKMFGLLCPCCGVLPTKVVRSIGQATLYEPCGHTDLLGIVEKNPSEER